VHEPVSEQSSSTSAPQEDHAQIRENLLARQA
jgi:hypothetical protein